MKVLSNTFFGPHELNWSKILSLCHQNHFCVCTERREGGSLKRSNFSLLIVNYVMR